ncbi:MAG: pyrroline-5-carboxylate reductase [Spirochaetales bacterium]|nr:pyrroline-5-carboxylate reductase [Spirochaetales bacterium]
MSSNVGFIGAGNMGGALIRGLLNQGEKSAQSVIVSDPSKDARERLAEEFPGIQLTEKNEAAAACPLLILAVKPHVLPLVCQSLQRTISPDTTVVSIAAGLTIQSIQKVLGGHEQVVRAMPNTPALVSQGVTALSASQKVDDESFEEVERVFSVVGSTLRLPERLMDAYTALAGSSPAWVFMFIEALADGAVREGIPRSTALEVAAQAVAGSAQLAVQSQRHPAELKDMVCSPGGTTIEAVAALEKFGFRSALMEAVSVCAAKARELGGPQ